MSKVETLFTPKDIQRVRDRLLLSQKNIDPITEQVIPVGQAVLDHDHKTQIVRAVLERNTNAFEGLVSNAYTRCLSWQCEKTLPDILRALANYLERDYSQNPIHTGWLKRVKIDFKKLKSADQEFVLSSLGVSAVCRNSSERLKEFSKEILKRKHSFEEVKNVLNPRLPLF